MLIAKKIKIFLIDYLDMLIEKRYGPNIIKHLPFSKPLN